MRKHCLPKLWKLQGEYVLLPLLYALDMKLFEDNKLPLAMGSWYNVNSHKVLYLFLFVALFQPIQIHYINMSLPHKIASKHCTLWSQLCVVHTTRMHHFTFLPFFLITNPRASTLLIMRMLGICVSGA
jgi:hypothetical protein